MDHTSDQSLSVQQAKERLRAAAGETGLTAYVKRRPYTALAVAFCAGILYASSQATREITKKELLRLLFRAL